MFGSSPSAAGKGVGSCEREEAGRWVRCSPLGSVSDFTEKGVIKGVTEKSESSPFQQLAGMFR